MAAALQVPTERVFASAEAYRAPYAALAYGDAMLSAWETGSEDKRRLEREAARYRSALAAALKRFA